MRFRVSLVFIPVLAAAQTRPVRLGDPINLIPPATSGDATTVVFAAAMALDGTPLKATNLYVFSLATNLPIHQLTNYAGAATWTGVTSVACAAGVAAYAAAPNGPGNAEEVHLIDTTSGADRTLATDKEGCIQPLCVGCARPCVGPVHVTTDARRVLYAVARQQPFFVVNADGSGLTRLPVYQGALAPSPQRVIGGGAVAFTSSAPSAAGIGAAATDIYVINLDGTGLRQVTKFGAPGFYASNATISADGSWIAFESNFSSSGPQPVTQVWLVRVDGTGLQQLSTGSDAASGPSISADGSMVAFLQKGQIVRVKTSPSVQTPLALTTLSTSVARDAAVSDDGRQVVFTVGPPFGSGAAVKRIPTESPSDVRSFLGIYAPRFLNDNGVASAAGVGPPTPGSILSAYGANLGPDELAEAKSFPLPTSLNELSLTVNGQAVPLLAVTPWQINAQLPQTMRAGTAVFQVRDASGFTLPPVSVAIDSFAPVNFAFPYVKGQLNYSQAAAFHAGTGLPADIDHPAAAGETLEIYGLGLGVTDPLVDAGLASPSSPPARSLQTPRLQIGGRDALVTFAGLAPGLAGVYQVNAVVPVGLAPGIHSLSWHGTVGTVSNSSVAVK